MRTVEHLLHSGCARGEQPRLAGVRAPQPEIDEPLARGHAPQARRFGGDDGLEMHQVQHARLDELSLG